MLERLNPALRILCLALGLLVAYQLARLITRKDPLADFRSGPWDKLKAVPSQERASVADAPGPTLQSSNPPTLTNGPMLTNGPTLANGSTPINAPTLSRSNAPTIFWVAASICAACLQTSASKAERLMWPASIRGVSSFSLTCSIS